MSNPPQRQDLFGNETPLPLPEIPLERPTIRDRRQIELEDAIARTKRQTPKEPT